MGMETNTTYAIKITANRKKFRQATSAMKRYGGEFDGKSKLWMFNEKPHPAAAQWGEVIEIEDTESADHDFDHHASI